VEFLLCSYYLRLRGTSCSDTRGRIRRQARGSLRGRRNKYQWRHGCLLQHDRPPPPNYLLLDSAAILWLWTWAQQSYQLYKKTHVLAFQSMANNTVTNFRVKCRISLLKQQCQYMSETWMDPPRWKNWFSFPSYETTISTWDTDQDWRSSITKTRSSPGPWDYPLGPVIRKDKKKKIRTNTPPSPSPRCNQSVTDCPVKIWNTLVNTRNKFKTHIMLK
jgi:hypothetical protein